MNLDVAKIAPKLWIGAAPPQGAAVGESGFESLVLCAVDWQPPEAQYPGVELKRAPFRDKPDVTSEEIKIAFDAARWTAERIKRGQRTLVTCMAGKNRSGLVCALALSMASGLDPAKCGEIVRRQRGLDALSNARFVDILNQARNDDCELCAAKKLTPWIYEDSLCWISVCVSCYLPLVVLRRHSTSPTTEEREHMLGGLKFVATQLAPGVRWRIDTERRKIPDHWHAHARMAERPAQRWAGGRS